MNDFESVREVAEGQAIAMFEDRAEFESNDVAKELAQENTLDITVGPDDDRGECRERVREIIDETWERLADEEDDAPAESEGPTGTDYSETYGRAIAKGHAACGGREYTHTGEVARIDVRDDGRLDVYFRDEDAPGGGVVMCGAHSIEYLHERR